MHRPKTNLARLQQHAAMLNIWCGNCAGEQASVTKYKPSAGRSGWTWGAGRQLTAVHVQCLPCPGGARRQWGHLRGRGAGAQQLMLDNFGSPYHAACASCHESRNDWTASKGREPNSDKPGSAHGQQTAQCTHLPPAPQSWLQWCRRCRRRRLPCPRHSRLEPGTTGAVFQHTLHTVGKHWAGKLGSGDPKHCCEQPGQQPLAGALRGMPAMASTQPTLEASRLCCQPRCASSPPAIKQ